MTGTKPFRKKNRKNGFGPAGQGQKTRNPNSSNGAVAGVCQKCGQPAPDGKLCVFHRNLLNSMRNGFR